MAQAACVPGPTLRSAKAHATFSRVVASACLALVRGGSTCWYGGATGSALPARVASRTCPRRWEEPVTIHWFLSPRERACLDADRCQLPSRGGPVRPQPQGTFGGCRAGHLTQALLILRSERW